LKPEQQIILADSAEAASIKTVTGWVSRTGRFWGDDERMARYDGSTHHKCEKCGSLVENRSYCQPCHEAKKIGEWASMPRATWNGTDLLYSHAADVYFHALDSLADYCHDNDCTPESLRLAICVPNYAHEIDPSDFFSDDMAEDGDLPSDLQEAFDALNAVIRQRSTPLSWSPGKFVPTSESVQMTPEQQSPTDPNSAWQPMAEAKILLNKDNVAT
jgi:hypothetical protein